MENNNEPIVLKTEKITYSEMTEREKKIYDEAYQRGYNAGNTNKLFIYWGLPMVILFIIVSVIAFVKILNFDRP